MRKIGRRSSKAVSLILLEEGLAKLYDLQVWNCSCGCAFMTVFYAVYHMEKMHPSETFESRFTLKKDFKKECNLWKKLYEDISENIFETIGSTNEVSSLNIARSEPTDQNQTEATTSIQEAVDQVGPSPIKEDASQHSHNDDVPLVDSKGNSGTIICHEEQIGPSASMEYAPQHSHDDDASPIDAEDVDRSTPDAPEESSCEPVDHRNSPEGKETSMSTSSYTPGDTVDAGGAANTPQVPTVALVEVQDPASGSVASDNDEYLTSESTEAGSKFRIYKTRELIERAADPSETFMDFCDREYSPCYETDEEDAPVTPTGHEQGPTEAVFSDDEYSENFESDTEDATAKSNGQENDPVEKEDSDEAEDAAMTPDGQEGAPTDLADFDDALTDFSDEEYSEEEETDEEDAEEDDQADARLCEKAPHARQELQPPVEIRKPCSRKSSSSPPPRRFSTESCYPPHPTSAEVQKNALCPYRPDHKRRASAANYPRPKKIPALMDLKLKPPENFNFGFCKNEEVAAGPEDKKPLVQSTVPDESIALKVKQQLALIAKGTTSEQRKYIPPEKRSVQKRFVVNIDKAKFQGLVEHTCILRDEQYYASKPLIPIPGPLHGDSPPVILLRQIINRPPFATIASSGPGHPNGPGHLDLPGDKSRNLLDHPHTKPLTSAERVRIARTVWSLSSAWPAIPRFSTTQAPNQGLEDQLQAKSPTAVNPDDEIDPKEDNQIARLAGRVGYGKRRRRSRKLASGVK